MIVLLLTVLFLFSPTANLKESHTSGELKQYVYRFEDLTKRPVTYSVRLAKYKDSSVVGTCYVLGSVRWVRINTLTWYDMHPLEREMLVFHELMHCTCNIDHDSRMFKRTFCPRSIMYPYTLGVHCIRTHYNHYITELKNRCK